MAIQLGSGGEMAVILRVKDDGSVVVEEFGEKSEDAFKKAGDGADKAGKKHKKFAADAKKYAAITIAAITAIAGVAVKVGADYEQAIANVASVAGASDAQLARISQSARDQARVSVFSATEAANAQYFLASAGLSVNQIIESQAGVMALAAATGSELAQTSEITTATLAQFGLQASDSARVANVYAAAISGSQANMQKLGDAMRYVGPVANALDQDIESTTAAISLLFNAGFKGEQAGTILRASLIALQKPSSEGAALIEQMGLKVNDASGKFIGFGPLIEQLADKQLSLNEAATIFGAEAAPGMLAMVKQGADAYEDMRKKITGTNKAQEMADQQTNTLTGDWKLLLSAMEESALVFYDDVGPAIRAVVQSITQMIEAMDYSLPGTSIFGTALKGIASIVVALNTTFQELGTAIGGTAAALVQFVSGDFSEAGDTLTEMKNDIVAIHNEADAMIDKVWANKQVLTDTPSPEGGAPVPGPVPDVGTVDAPVGRGDVEEAQTEKLREQLALQAETLAESYLTETEARFAQYADEQMMLEEALEAQAITEQEYQDLTLASRRAYEDELNAISQAGMSREQQMWQSGWQGKLNVMSGVLGMISNLMNSENKKQFEIGKKAALVKTAIDTYTMAVGAYNALASIPIVGPALGAAAAAAALLYGKAQYKNIKNQKFGGSGSVASTAASSTLSANTSSSSPVTSNTQPAPSSVQQTQAEAVKRVDLHLRGSDMFSAESIRDVLGPALVDAYGDGALELNVDVA